MLENKIITKLLTKERLLFIYELYEIYSHSNENVKFIDVKNRYEDNFETKKPNCYRFIKEFEEIGIIKTKKVGRIKIISSINLKVVEKIHSLIEQLKTEIIFKK